MKVFSNRSAITKMQAAIIAVIIVVAAIAGVVYYVYYRPEPAPPPERVLRVGFAWPTYIDPAVGSDFSSSASLCNLYDPLVWPTPEGDVEPWVAESWTSSADGLEWTFTIRKGIKFHTGNELTAEDVEFTMERLLTIGEGYSYLFAPYVDTVNVVDSDKVEFTLKKTFGPFLISLVRLYILEKAEVMDNIETPGPYGEFGDYGKTWLLTNDAGSGAYMVTDRSLDEWFQFELFEDYWGYVDPLAPTIIKYSWTSASPPTTRTMMLTGELEVTDQWMPAEIMAALDAEPGISLVSTPESSQYYYMLHTKKPPLDDIHVRKALAYALDYGDMMAEIYARYTVSTGVVPKGLPGYAETQIYTRNLTKAEEELTLSKYYPDIVENPDNYVIKFHWIAEVPERERDALLFAEDAAELGLKVELVKTPWLKTIEEMADPEVSGHIYNILVAAHYPEAGSLIESRYHSKNVKSWEQNEWLEDPELDAKIEDALATVDINARFAKYAQVQEDIMALCPSMFIYDYRATYCIQDYVKIPAVEDPSDAVLVMGYNYIHRLWQREIPE